MHPRRRPTKAAIEAVLARQEGKCACGCGERLNGAVDWDHILPLALGGTNEADNWQALLRACHRAKTAGDIRMIRKADRQRNKHLGIETRRKKPIPSRPFPKNHRPFAKRVKR